MSPRIFVIAIALILCAASGASARQRIDIVVNPNDEIYVQQLALEGLAGLESGYDGLQMATRQDVREFALLVVNRHAPSLKQLERFAAEHRVAFPGSVSGHAEYEPERPWENETVGFDRAFMEGQVRQLERESEAIARVATLADNADLRAFAWSRLAVARQQLARAREIVWQLDLDDVR